MPWKVFFGGTGMIILETGKESPAAEVSCIQVTMILQELRKKNNPMNKSSSNSHNYVVVDCSNNFFHFLGH